MMDERYKKLVLLHSNDMHGDFLAEDVDNKLVGGVSMLSGYISKVKQEEQNVLYCVAGDMFRGSVIDSEYKGVSTIEVMNMLAPDVVTIGNHETDYGLSHLLFIEKCAKFPIINANLYIKMNGARLFNPYHIIEIGGMKILFIGILTQDVMSATKNDAVIGSLVDINDAAEEITKICNTFNGIDIDFTVLLTHIGFDKDKELASILDPALGVDVIIGGHSHTFMDEPCKVNDILIVQAGTGTDQIGRFDIVVDTDTNSVASYTWKAIPINNENCPTDDKIEGLIGKLKSETDLKYGKILRRLNTTLTHPTRYAQTSLGSFVADCFKYITKADAVLTASGSIRSKSLGPIITLQDMMECYPYKDALYEVLVSGEQLKRIYEFIYRDENNQDNDTEFYQLSEGMYIEYSKSLKKITTFKLNGEDLDMKKLYKFVIRHFDFASMKKFLNIDPQEILSNGPKKVICTSAPEALYEFLESKEKLPNYPDESRLKIVD